MKKIIALLLAVMMVLAMAACAAKTTDTPAPAETDNKTDAVQETATEAAADGKTELNIGVLVWKYSDTYGSSVRVAMDKYAKEIGVEIELRPMSAYDALAQLSVQVAGGDDLDLVMLLLQSVKAWTDQGLLEPLDDYLAADAPYISEFRKTVDICAGTYTDGKAYAVVRQQRGLCCGQGLSG